MSDKRIRDLAVTATSLSNDDYLPVDGIAEDTRKILASSLALDEEVPLTATFVYSNGGYYAPRMFYGDIPSSWASYLTDPSTLILGTSATTIGDSSFQFSGGLTGNLVIPNSITSIGDNAFRDCSGFTSLTIGNGVTTIGDYAFGSEFATSPQYSGNLIIPDSVVTIGISAFKVCAVFSSLTLGNSLETIGGWAFAGSVIGGFPMSFSGDLFIPNSVTSIGAAAFEACAFTRVIIPSSATNVGSLAFYYCGSLTTAYLNQPIGQVGSDAFFYSGLTNVYIGPDATGYTLGSGQTIGGKSGVTVSVWTNYPNVP